MSRTRLTLAALILMSSAGAANASDWNDNAPQLGANLQWTFGGPTTAASHAGRLSAALTVAQGPFAAASLLHWQPASDGTASLRLLGMPVNPSPGPLRANDQGGAALMLPALVLAGGIAVALMVDSAGKAAKRQQR